MLAPIVVAILVAHAPVTAPVGATQQPSASPEQSTPEKLWPPAGVVRAAPGSGVTSPRLIKSTPAFYTAEAMKALVQGVVVMEAVVETDGTVGEVRVVRSLDKEHGMDEEAVKAVTQWRFAPGKKDGVAVAVLVDVEMAFRTDVPKRNRASTTRPNTRCTPE